MKIKRLSLRARIFVAMILLVLLASILIAAVTIYQYNEEAKDYHRERLERKEKAIRKSIDFAIEKTTYPVTTENIPLIFKDAIFDIDAVHSQKINLYDLEGQLLKSSKRTIQSVTTEVCIDAEILNTLSNTVEHRYVFKKDENGQTFQSSYSYITDEKFKNLAILNLPYLENDDFLNRELNEFLLRLGYAYLAMILAAIVFAYFISKYITKSLKTISDKMNEIRLEKRNKKIEIESTSEEIVSKTRANLIINDRLSSSNSMRIKNKEMVLAHAKL